MLSSNTRLLGNRIPLGTKSKSCLFVTSAAVATGFLSSRLLLEEGTNDKAKKANKIAATTVDSSSYQSKLNSLTSTNSSSFWHQKSSSVHFSALSPFACQCEASSIIDNSSNETTGPPHTTAYRNPSKLRQILAKVRILSLPVPRLIQPNDYHVFTYPQLTRGLKQRSKDEIKLAKLGDKARNAAESGDVKKITEVATLLCEVAYGRGVSPQKRQDFLIKYGCAAWSEEALTVIHNLGKNTGIVEVGAGNGQWARTISDYNSRTLNTNNEESKATTSTTPNDDSRERKHHQVEFIMAYDNMLSLPLSPDIYHSNTKPAHEHFYKNVRKGDYRMLRTPETRGRVLLLVFPPPGPMAAATVKEYMEGFVQGNDTVIFVGEGRGGANADDEFFDMFGNGEWALLRVMDLPKPDGAGDKGFEKMFVMKRVAMASLSEDDINTDRVLQWNG